MNNKTKEILELLPYKYDKQPGTNNYKVYSLIGSIIEELNRHQEQIRTSRNIDKATGKVLDLIGGNYSQPRQVSQNDEEYRLYIKTKIAADMSQGDIETINRIMSLLLGKVFIGIEETWNKEVFENEIAGIAVRLRNTTDISQAKIINKIRAAGVAVKYILEFEPEEPGEDGETKPPTVPGDPGWDPDQEEYIGKIFMATTTTYAKIITIYPYALENTEVESKYFIAVGTPTITEVVTIEI